MEIKCDYQILDWIQLGRFYTCYITSASIKEPNQEIKAIIGQHKPRKTDRAVEAIWFHETKVNFMPKGINKIFPNLKAIWIEKCGLKEIAREDLAEFENILELSVDKNELTSLPDDLFEGMKILKRIDFSNNKLEFVSSQLLEPALVNQLIFADFRNNSTINAVFDSSEKNLSEIFVDLPGLFQLIDEKCKKREDKSFEAFKNSLTHELKSFWNSRELSDFTIIVGERKFCVHKFALALQSGSFRRLLSNQAENITELDKEKYSAEAVEETLRYIYTGKIPDVKNSIKIFELSVDFEISALKTIAEDLVIRSINQDNALEVLKLGSKSEKIKKEAFEEIKKIVKDPEMDEDLMEDPEELQKYVEVKLEAKNMCNEILERCKKRKMND